jgi:hypothetical protein
LVETIEAHGTRTARAVLRSDDGTILQWKHSRVENDVGMTPFMIHRLVIILFQAIKIVRKNREPHMEEKNRMSFANRKLILCEEIRDCSLKIDYHQALGVRERYPGTLA